ncbi:hypothetical protein P8Q88_08670 [Qipengyuania sp. XHP0207]|uniref:hypothetical protein n=1 Tax=Qipengyuania sp. XHP0207 TaxID=3038078 RepID=UPI00241C23ED|nr:hypothetical protein [Qipengyuania sp. XHP0207]MDG5748254.1 hypothetical protein [Qipengyuania sp. XHP0207]
MAKAKRAKRPPRQWKDKFLAELARTSNVAAAARKANVDPGAVYKARRSDAEFYRNWQEALAEGYDNLEMDLLRRLRIGELTGGGPTKSRRKFDNAIAFRLLAAHREAVGRQKALRANEDEDAIIASINEKLSKMRERRLAMEAETGKAGVYRVDPDGE